MSESVTEQKAVRTHRSVAYTRAKQGTTTFKLSAILQWKACFYVGVVLHIAATCTHKNSFALAALPLIF